LVTAAITAAPAMLTALYCFSAIALVDFTMSAMPTSQSSGSGVYCAGSIRLRKPRRIGTVA
jgi:hypothetical protein